MDSRKNKFLIIYFLINVFTLSMLFMLQISEIPIFFLWLVLMHVGIVGLALTKKHFKDLGVKPYFTRVYLSFALFIPVLIYKLIMAILSLEENHELVTITVYLVMMICILILILNTVFFILRNKNQAPL